MHNIYDCIDSFTLLLDMKYLFVLGRKSASVTLNISFDKKDCFHLMRLQYLADRADLRRDRGFPAGHKGLFKGSGIMDIAV